MTETLTPTEDDVLFIDVDAETKHPGNQKHMDLIL